MFRLYLRAFIRPFINVDTGHLNVKKSVLVFEMYLGGDEIESVLGYRPS